MTSNKITPIHRSLELTEYEIWIDEDNVYRYQNSNKRATDNLTVYHDDEQTQVSY